MIFPTPKTPFLSLSIYIYIYILIYLYLSLYLSLSLFISLPLALYFFVLKILPHFASSYISYPPDLSVMAIFPSPNHHFYLYFSSKFHITLPLYCSVTHPPFTQRSFFYHLNRHYPPYLLHLFLLKILPLLASSSFDKLLSLSARTVFYLQNPHLPLLILHKISYR